MPLFGFLHFHYITTSHMVARPILLKHYTNGSIRPCSFWKIFSCIVFSGSHAARRQAVLSGEVPGGFFWTGRQGLREYPVGLVVSRDR